jgi:SAM-dependent methyltransferase
MKLIEWLKLPQTKDIEDLNMPSTTVLHSKIIMQKKFLKRLYEDFYREFQKSIGRTEGKKIIELGSGGGFIKDVISGAITSDIIDGIGADMVFSAMEMPFENSSIDYFVMIDVLHHIPDVRRFFSEAYRTLKVGGKIIMIEPANTMWGRFIYKNFHHEPFDENGGWNIQGVGALSGANGAIPWIVFTRDRKIFERDFPCLMVVKEEFHTPLRYLLSGGLSLRQLVPSFSYSFFKILEFLLQPFNRFIGMFETIEIIKTQEQD